MTQILGPLPCSKCGGTVVIDRIGAYIRVLEGHRVHVCRPAMVPLLETPGPEICGAWMRNVEERCARRAGHATDERNRGHRRRCVMDDDNRARSGRRAA